MRSRYFRTMLCSSAWLIFASQIAFTQNSTMNSSLIGLPEHGVSLAGDVNAPIVVNASNRTILGYTVRFEDASGRGVNSKQLYLLDLRNQRSAGIAPGAQRSTNTALQVMAGVGPIVRALLDAVLFQDGEMVGPDKTQTFESVVARISAERDLSNKVLAARNGSTAEREAIWSFISDVAQARAVASAIQAQGDVDIYRKTHKATAAELLRVRDSSGVVAAYDLAGKSIVYPNIWRQK